MPSPALPLFSPSRAPLVLQAAAARLAELEYFFPGGGAPAGARSGRLGQGAGYDAEAKVQALWVWDLSTDLSVPPEGTSGRRAWRLTRTLAEGCATLLASAWQDSPANVRTIFVPMAGAALERQVGAGHLLFSLQTPAQLSWPVHFSPAAAAAHRRCTAAPRCPNRRRRCRCWGA